MQKLIDEQQKVAALQRQGCFQDLSQFHLNELLKVAKVVNFTKGNTIVTEGDLVDCVYVILKGTAEVFSADNTLPKNVPIETLEEGEAIGLNALGFYSMTGQRLATVVAATDVVTLRIDLDDLVKYITEHPEVNLSEDTIKRYLRRNDFLRNVAPFSHLPAAQLHKLSLLINEKQIFAGTIIFKNGEVGHCCYLLNKGKVELSTTDLNGNKKILTTLEPPAIFGEAAILLEAPRNATAIALTDCELWELNSDCILDLFESDEVSKRLLTELMFQRYRPIKLSNIECYTRETNDGDTIYIIKNPDISRYFRLTAKTWFVWNQLDGTRTIRDIIIDYFIEFDAFAPDMIFHLISSLVKEGFIEDELIGLVPEKKSQCSIWMRIKKRIGATFNYKRSFSNVDNFLGKLYEKVGFVLFKPVIVRGALLLGLLGMLTYFYEASSMQASIVNTSNAWLMLVLLMPLRVITVGFHELGHAFAVKYFGRHVNRLGVGWQGINPVAFVDTSDMWLSTARNRFIVDLSGIYIDFIMATLFVLIALMVGNSIVGAFIWLLATSHYVSILENMNPLAEYDGYYALSDILDRSHLKKNVYFELIEWFKNKKEKADSHSKIFKYYWCYAIFYIGLMTLVFAFIQYYILLPMLPLRTQDWFYGAHGFFWILPTIIFISGFVRIGIDTYRFAKLYDQQHS